MTFALLLINKTILYELIETRHIIEEDSGNPDHSSSNIIKKN